MLVDFHSHTRESDGTLEPAELSAAMRKRGVEIFAITDHDSLGAYAKLGDTAGSATVVTGIELNTTYRGNEVHVLGYGFPLDSEEIDRAITGNRRQRELRAERMVEQLGAAGYELDMANVRAEAGHADSSLGRPHVARALVRAGYVSDLERAFRDLLVPGKPGYVPQLYMRPHDAVGLILRAGGVAVLAHPGRLKDESIIDELIEAGIGGIETFYPSHSPGQVAHFREIAAGAGLVLTAGSDFHDPKYSPAGVGMEVDREDLQPFFDLVL